MASYGLHHTITSCTREFKESKTAIDNIFTDIDDRVFTSKVLRPALSDRHAHAATVTHELTPRCTQYLNTE